MHLDEAVHAVKLDTLYRTGNYVYDRSEYHGPTLYYLTAPLMWLSGARSFADVDERTLRLAPALLGAGLVLLLWPLANELGRWAALWAGILVAISPAMVFYSRYYIQETILVFLSFCLIVSAWLYVRSGRAMWCLLAGVCLGLMHATKETWVLSVAAMLLAVPLTVLWTRAIDGRRIAWKHHIRPRLKLLSLTLGILVSVVLLSGFFTNARGPLDSVLTYSAYFDRSRADADHNHAWNYYFDLLLWNRFGPGLAPLRHMSTLPGFSPLDAGKFLWKASQPPLLWTELFIFVLAIVGIIAALWRKNAKNGDVENSVGNGVENHSLLRFLAFYTLVLAVIYCAIPYKTPWCLLGFWHGAVVMAGFGVVATVRVVPGRVLKTIVCAVLVLAGVHLSQQSRAANFLYADDRRNPYVYAHTLRDMVRLGERVEALSQLDPKGREMLVTVIAPDPWPLPWSLRRFKNVGYWNDVKSVPPQARQAPIVIVALELQPQWKKTQGAANYNEEVYGQRPETFLVVNARGDLWREFLRRRSQITTKPDAGVAANQTR